MPSFPFEFALVDWVQLAIGGNIDCYVRPDRPYTILIHRDRSKVALTPQRASNQNWYHEEFMRLLDAGETMSLNQQNVFYFECKAILIEASLGLTYPHFYQDLDILRQQDTVYLAVFRVEYALGGNLKVGYLGVRSRQEYLAVSNAVEPLKDWPQNTLPSQKATNIITSFIGHLPLDIREIGYSSNGTSYIWH